MSKYKKTGFFNSFKNAGRGIRLSIKSEKNVRFHIFAAFLRVKNIFSVHSRLPQIAFYGSRRACFYTSVARDARRIIFTLLLKMSIAKICILILAISNVFVAEFINTSLEYGLDAVFHNRYSRLVGMAKDISAGAVMFASLISILVGLILFGRHLI